MIVYKISNLINGKTYIGQSQHSLSIRIAKHLKTNSIIGKALRKYDLNSFEISIIDIASSKEVLDEKEKYWVKVFNSKIPNGYNMTDGGEGSNGYKHSEESKRKIGRKGLGRKISFKTKDKLKKPRPEKVKEKIRLTMLGKKKTEEHRRKISLATTGERHPFFGKHLTDEHKSKIRDALSGEKNPMYGKEPWNKNKQEPLIS